MCPTRTTALFGGRKVTCAPFGCWIHRWPTTTQDTAAQNEIQGASRIAVNYLLNLRRTGHEQRGISFELLGADLADGLAGTAYAGPETELLALEVKLGCTQAMLQCLDRPLRVTYVLGEVFLRGAPGPIPGGTVPAAVRALSVAVGRARLSGGIGGG